MKGKGEKERYAHMNAAFQRLARRDKNVILSEQCKEIEENNRMGMTRDLFKKIRDTKGTFHAKMGTKKGRNSMDLIEVEEIKKRWQEYTELYKKDLHDPDNHDGVITHLEPDILESNVNWVLGSITMNKTSGGRILSEQNQIEFQLSYFSPKRCCCESAALNMLANLDNSAVATGLEKVSFHSSPKERQCQRMLKLPHNCTHLTC